MSAAGNPERHPCRDAGFTLLELLIVVAIVAMASVGVTLALRDGSRVQLEREAERLAALLESARARSQVSGVAVRWLVTESGFRFEGLDPAQLPGQWLDADTRAPAEASLWLGPEPIIGAQSLTLRSQREPTRQVTLATDGLRPFALQPAAP